MKETIQFVEGLKGLILRKNKDISEENRVSFFAKGKVRNEEWKRLEKLFVFGAFRIGGV